MVLVPWNSRNHGSVENDPKLKGHRENWRYTHFNPLKHVEPWEVSGISSSNSSELESMFLNWNL